MKKLVFCLIIVLILSFSLSGCYLTVRPVPKNESQIIIDNDKTTRTTVPTVKEKAATVGQTIIGKKWAISLLSAKIYTEIVEDDFSDIPGEGNVYLTLFFDVENISDEDAYFNRLDFESYVDGYNQHHITLLTSPDGYRTLTGDIASGKRLKGCLIWEVSSNWKELEVSHSSYYDNGKKATFIVTPEDVIKG